MGWMRAQALAPVGGCETRGQWVSAKNSTTPGTTTSPV